MGLVTNEGLILGCDSIASATTPIIRPFEAGIAKRDSSGALEIDNDGNILVAINHIEQIVTDVFSGVTKMFGIYDKANTNVAATTAGMAKLNGRTIASLARDFLEKENQKQSKALVNVEAVANTFLRFFRRKYEKDQRGTQLPQQYWEDLEFLVGGYGRNDAFPSLYRISVKSNDVKKEFANGDSGLSWAGQADSVERVLRGYDSALRVHVENHIDMLMDKHHANMSSAILRILKETLEALDAKMPDGINTKLPSKPVANLGWEQFNPFIDYSNLPMQDAIEFVSFLAFLQSGRQKFSQGFATVGGRIHVGLVCKGTKFKMLNEPELAHKHTGFLNDV